jgi:hypothetical protein
LPKKKLDELNVFKQPEAPAGAVATRWMSQVTSNAMCPHLIAYFPVLRVIS